MLPLQRCFNKTPKIDRKTINNPPKIDQNSFKNRSKIRFWNFFLLKPKKGVPRSICDTISGGFWAPLGAQWPHVGFQNRAKIENKSMPKSIQKIDAFWNRFLEGFWCILGGKMEASWHPNGVKNVHNFERRFFEKSLFFPRKNHYFQGSEGLSWEQKQIKNRS